MSGRRQLAPPPLMTTAAEAGVVADRESGPSTVAAVRTKPMNRCLRILRLLEVAESPEGSKGPGMRAAVFGAFVSRVGAGMGGATLDAK